MMGHIYYVLSESFIIIVVAMIAHYVFLEPGWKKWQYFLNGAFLLLLINGEIFIQAEERLLFSLLYAGVNISIARNKHHIRGFFLVFPIMGICMGIIMPLIFLPEFLFVMGEDTCEIFADLLSLVVLLLFIWKGKSWRERFELELQYRKLQKWEKRLLILVGLVLFWLMVPVEDITMLPYIDYELKAYVILSSISAMILTITVVVLVMQGNERAYYENVAALNEGYLNAEVRHFQAYQKAQTETRRVRHDMKNHLNSMCYLAKEKKYHELEQYLEELGASVEHIDTELHCGNALADAICNEKNQLAIIKDISFEIEGKMPENSNIEPVDICTILSNALDNAIEAVENSNLEKRWIKLVITCQGDIIFLHFTNPVSEQQAETFHGITFHENTFHEKKFYGKTSKKDKLNHGFGLQNIRLAAEKYGGEVNVEIYKEKDESIFSLEIMLMN